MSTWSFMSTKGQVHSQTLVQKSLRFNFWFPARHFYISIFNNFLVCSPICMKFVLNSLVLEILHFGLTVSDPFPLNFLNNLWANWSQKFVQIVQATWPIWLPCPYMVKTFKNLLWNRKDDDLETWYTALSTSVLPSLFKLCPWVDLTDFMARSNLVPYAFIWPIVVYDTKVGRCSQLNEYMKLDWPWSKSLRFNIFKLFSSISADFKISSALRWEIQDQWSSGFKF